MSSSEFLDNYKQVGSTIRKLYDSSLRLGILDALSNGPMRLADLRRAVNANAPNTSTKAKELEKMGLIDRVDGDYCLTPWGEIILENIKDSVKLFSTHTLNKEYWDTHLIDEVPVFLRNRLSAFNTAKIIKPKPDDIDWVDNNFINLSLKTKKRLWGMSPVFRKEYIKTMLTLAKNGVDVKIIVPRSLLKSLLPALMKNVFSVLKKPKNLEFYVIDEDIGWGFGIGDDFCTASFRSGTDHDTFMDMNLVSHDSECIKFTLDAFDYYLKQAKPVKLSDYLK